MISDISQNNTTKESVHRQFRKVTRSKSQFPDDIPVMKMLYLSSIEVSKKWTMRLPNWNRIWRHGGIPHVYQLKGLGNKKGKNSFDILCILKLKIYQK